MIEPNKSFTYKVELINAKGFSDLDIIFESAEDDYLSIAKNLKKKFRGKTKILCISREFHSPFAPELPISGWDVIKKYS